MCWVSLRLIALLKLDISYSCEKFLVVFASQKNIASTDTVEFKNSLLSLSSVEVVHITDVQGDGELKYKDTTQSVKDLYKSCVNDEGWNANHARWIFLKK